MAESRFLAEARERLGLALGGSLAPIHAPVRPKGKRERLLVFSDTHCPFTRLDLVARMLQEEDADRAIFVGDVDDLYAVSKYPKDVSTCPALKSLAASRALLERVAERYPAVDVIRGNHDARLEKHLRTRLEPDVLDALRLLAGGSLDPIRAITRDIPNIRMVGTDVEDYHVRWFYQLGDVLFVHAEKFSNVPGAAVQAVHRWFARMQRQLGLKPFRVLVQAHTHQLSWIPVDADTLLLECGCLCATQSYQLGPKVAGLPQRQGYITLEMENGKAVIDSVRIRWFE